MKPKIKTNNEYKYYDGNIYFKNDELRRLEENNIDVFEMRSFSDNESVIIYYNTDGDVHRLLDFNKNDLEQINYINSMFKFLYDNNLLTEKAKRKYLFGSQYLDGREGSKLNQLKDIKIINFKIYFGDVTLTFENNKTVILEKFNMCLYNELLDYLNDNLTLSDELIIALEK